MKNTKSYPLRKIVGIEEDKFGLSWEVLECGHKNLPKHDIYGETNATRRRCRHCAKQKV